MKAIACALVLGFVAAVVANGSVVPPDESLMLLVQADGTAELVNTTGAPLAFDAYTIESSIGGLDPVGWVSIPDAVTVDMVGVVAALGTGALSFGELSATVSNLTDANLGNSALLGAGASWSIGDIIGTSSDGITFTWKSPNGSDVFQGGLTVVPEPTTMAMLGLGLVGFIARKRRKS